MSVVEFERMLAALLPSPGAVALTITELPERDDHLFGIVQSALLLGRRLQSQLTEVHAPRERMAALSGRFADLRIDEGSDVLRLVFEG